MELTPASWCEMTVGYISHADCGRHDTGWKHPEHVGRLRAIPRALRDDYDLYQNLLHHEGRHATPEELALVHDAAYIESVREASAAGGRHFDADTIASEGTWDAARAGAGCVLDAVDMAFDGRALRSFCAIRPPGHHALRARAMGFCFFGNVALATRYARTHHHADRVLIIDWDVHHGNGTQSLVEQDVGIHFVSMHQWPWYPGTGAREDRGPLGTIWNVPLPGGLPSTLYVDALQQGVDAATQDFTPDLVLISAGFDSLAGDPLGGFTLELDDFKRLTREICERANTWCGGRLVAALEGGYDPSRLGAAAVTLLHALSDE
jgi:acetoin utilization deacetylase AcuC-like enzyme